MPRGARRDDHSACGVESVALTPVKCVRRVAPLPDKSAFEYHNRLARLTPVKADRAASTLRVLAAHAESGVPIASFAEPLAAELRLMAQWLGLERTTVARRGDASAALKSHRK